MQSKNSESENQSKKRGKGFRSKAYHDGFSDDGS